MGLPLQDLADEIGLTVEATKRLLEKFLEVTRQDIEELKIAAGEGDFTRMREIAHHIKGAAVNMNLIELKTAAEKIEAAAGSIEEQTKTAELLGDIEKSFARVRALLDTDNGKI